MASECRAILHAMRRFALCVLLISRILPLTAQAPAGRDSARTDTARATRMPELDVRVTRTGESRSSLPMAVGIVPRDIIRRGQLTVGLDESLSRLPGVIVLNRYNYSLDQRVSLRGAGSRAKSAPEDLRIHLAFLPVIPESVGPY